MIKFLKSNIVFIAFLSVFGIAGGYFTSLYMLETPAMLEEAIAQIGSIEIFTLVYILQSFVYAVVLGLVGKALAEKIGLWKSPSIEFKPVFSVILVSLIGGALFILGDYYVFGNFIDAVKTSYLAKPTLNYVIASITYGGVVEEVMLRLFFMSLIAFLLHKFSRKSEVTDSQVIIANIIAAILFAAGHLPATVAMMELTPIVLIRCFLMNGGFGLVFGRLYRKHGIQYAMLAHAGLHIVSKLIWIFFI
jgi:hypothetical protein